jgi:hypothetical protein
MVLTIFEFFFTRMPLSRVSRNLTLKGPMAALSILDTFDTETLANVVRSENVQRIETRFDGLINGTISDSTERRKGTSSSSAARAYKRKRPEGGEESDAGGGGGAVTSDSGGGGGSRVSVDSAHLLDLAVEPAERPPMIDGVYPETAGVHYRVIKDLLAFSRRPLFYSPDGLTYDQIHGLAFEAWAAEGVFEAEGKTARARNREEVVWRGDVEAAFCERAREALAKRASRR